MVSRRFLELGHSFDCEFYTSTLFLTSWLAMLGLETLSKLLRFLISHGMDLESRASLLGKTPLLHMARTPSKTSITIMHVLLEHGADCTATDDLGMGPLHLALEAYNDQWVLNCLEKLWSHLHMEKLVLLLRAGCSVNAVNHRGEAPGDYARRIRADAIWMSALQEVGLSDGEVVDSSLGQASNPDLIMAPPSLMSTFAYSRQPRTDT